MHFTTPLYFLWALAIIPLLWWANRQRKALGHSQVSDLDGIRSVPFIGRTPNFCRAVFIALLLIIAAQPQVIHKLVHTVIQTRDFLITVDVSGSMNTPLADPQQVEFTQSQAAAVANGSTPTTPAVPGQTPPPTAAPGSPTNGTPATGTPATATPATGTPATTTAAPKPTRAMAAREGVRQFLLRRKYDRVGLITFDDRCYYSEPIGKPEAVTKKLDAILHHGNGTNFDGPSESNSAPGAIHCSIEHFIEMKATKTRVFIMVTDGEDSISPERAEFLAKAIHDQHIRMYVLGVGEGWAKSDKTALEQFVERPEVAGKVIRIGDAKQMREAFDQIDKLEKSNTEIEVLQSAQELYPYFALAAFVVLLLWIRVAAYVRDQV